MAIGIAARGVRIEPAAAFRIFGVELVPANAGMAAKSSNPLPTAKGRNPSDPITARSAGPTANPTDWAAV